MIDNEETSNYETFRDCFSGPVIQKSAAEKSKPKTRRSSKGRKNAIKPVASTSHDAADEQNADDLAEFIDVRGFIF